MKGKHFLFFVFLFVSVFISFVSYSGNPMKVTLDGKPIRRDISKPIKYKIDTHGLGRLTLEQSKALVDLALQKWQSVKGTGITFEYAGTEAATKALKYFKSLKTEKKATAGDHIVYYKQLEDSLEDYILFTFDNDGTLTSNMTGSQQTPGVTRIVVNLSQGLIVGQTQVIINGLMMDGDNSREPDLTLADELVVVIHEVGHALGLDHSTLNFSIYNDRLYYPASPEFLGYIPAMFPFVVNGMGNYRTNLHPDDVATLKWLYDTTDNIAFKGTVFDSSGIKRIPGIQVTARSIASPLCQAFSQISGITCNFLLGKCTDNEEGNFVLSVLENSAHTLEVGETDKFYNRVRIGDFQYVQRYFPDIPGGAEFFNTDDQANEPYDLLTTLTVSNAPASIDFILSGSQATGNELKRIPLDYFKNHEPFVLNADPDCEKSNEDVAALIGAEEIVKNPAPNNTSPQPTGIAAPTVEPTGNSPQPTQEATPLPSAGSDSPGTGGGGGGSGTDGGSQADNNPPTSNDPSEPTPDNSTPLDETDDVASSGGGGGGGCTLATGGNESNSMVVLLLGLLILLNHRVLFSKCWLPGQTFTCLLRSPKTGKTKRTHACRFWWPL